MIKGWSQLLSHPVSLKHVVPHLSIIDIMSLKRVVPLAHIKVFELFCNRLALWMARKCFPDTFIQDLIQQLSDPRGHLHLTGSLALMLLLGEDWIVGDMDLIATQWSSVTEHNMYQYWGLTFRQIIYVPHAVEDSKLYMHSKVLDNVVTRYQSDNGFKVQFLLTGQVEAYLKTFDFDFCQNCIGNGKILVRHPRSVLKKKMDPPLKLSSYFPKNIQEPLFLFHTFLPKRFVRFKTYQDRGFDFTLQMGCIDDYTNFNAFEKGQILAYWEMFWSWCIRRDGKFIGSKMPEWKL